MGQVLYRKYRPKGLEDVVGQEHVTTTLAHAIKAGTISHAYLFTGPRGVGKTSIARILAHEINDLPYTDESIHLDIIEIDAASNRRIDEIRDLRDKVHIAPTSAKYKVYIIDEVHMLTREAFNALLKTLEEPPAHVVFILATTEAHKLPETIISRTQRFAFKPVPLEKVVAHLRSIADKEKIKVDDEALTLIAEYGDGSFRDSISMLDQMRNQAKTVTANDVRVSLGLAPDKAIKELIDELTAHNAIQVVATLSHFNAQGLEATQIATQLGTGLRKQLLDQSTGMSADEILPLSKDLLAVTSSSNPMLALELALLSTAFSSEHPQPVSPDNYVKIEAKADDTPEPKEKSETTKAASKNLSDDELWPQVLETIKNQHNTLYSVLRMAKPRFDSDNLELGLEFAFHQKRLQEAKNQQIVADTIEQLNGKKLKITYILLGSDSKTAPSTAKKPSVETTTALDAISDIFGGAELLES